MAAVTRVVIPALSRFKPDFVFEPSGFDAGAFDPLDRNMMHGDGYRRRTERLLGASAELSDRRLLLCHEGGYSRATGPFHGLAGMETLSGIRAGVEDPSLAMALGFPGQALLRHREGRSKPPGETPRWPDSRSPGAAKPHSYDWRRP